MLRRLLTTVFDVAASQLGLDEKVNEVWCEGGRHDYLISGPLFQS
jgi:hypothetical protein